MKNARSWIIQESIVCSIFIVDKRTDVNGIDIEPVLLLTEAMRIECLTQVHKILTTYIWSIFVMWLGSWFLVTV